MAKIKKKISKKDGDSVKIFGVALNSSRASKLLARIAKRIEADRKTFVVTPNSEFLVFAQKNPWFRDILSKADMAVLDGIGLVWAREVMKKEGFWERLWRGFLTGLKVLRGKLADRVISGTDLVEKLCQEAAKRGWEVYLLGGQPGVARKALEVLKRRYPGLRGWADSGPVVEVDSNGKLAIKTPRMAARRNSSGVEVIKAINQYHPDLLFIAFGMGKQEKFIWENWDQLKVKLAMGVGGAFDYISGRVPRAPKWIRNLGLEWLYRLIHEPWRWKRQLALVKFIWLVLKEKLISQGSITP